MKTYLLLAVALLLPISSFGGEEELRSIQRFRVVASADHGNKVAILLSHFGPSSQAPFVNLIIKEAGNPKTTTLDSEFAFGVGDEQSLRNLEMRVIQKSKPKLQSLGFVPESAQELPSFWEGGVGQVDLMNNSPYQTFHFTSLPISCSRDQVGLDWQICDDRARCVQATLDHGTPCATIAIYPTQVIQIERALWVVVKRKIRGLASTTAVVLDFAAIAR